MNADLVALAERVGKFVLKPWDVTVDGYGTGRYYAATRGKALADAWRSDAFSGSTFGEFLKFARCRRGTAWGEDYGALITVSGKPAYFVERNAAYVQFVWPDSDVILSSHPYDVLPERFRPAAYRARASIVNDTQGGVDA